LLRDLRHQEAEELLLRCIEIWQDNDIGATVEATMKLALAYRGQGRLKSAEELLVVLARTRTDLDPKLPRILAHLAGVYKEQNRLDAAGVIYQTLANRLISNMEVDNRLLEILNNFATVLFSQREFAQARELQEFVSKKATEHLGETHPLTINSNACLAKVYLQLEMYTEAVRLQELSLTHYQSIFEETHERVLTEMGALARVYIHHGKVQAGRELIETCLERSERVFPSNHEFIFQSKSILAEAYLQAARLEESEQSRKALIRNALQLWQECLKFTEVAFGESHPDTLRMLTSIIHCHDELDEIETARDLGELYFHRRYEILTNPESIAAWFNQHRATG